jgi:transposase
LAIHCDLDLSVLNLDGTQSLAKKGGEKVAYQGRKKGKTSNILSITDRNGYVIASTSILGGNHNDSFELKLNLNIAFRDMKKLGLCIQGAYFNADSSFDTKEGRKTCFNHGVIPNIPENRRNRKRAKLGRNLLFNEEVYHQRFTEERTFAWVDKFKRLLIRFERDEELFFGAHCIAFTMINLRHLLVRAESNVKELEEP